MKRTMTLKEFERYMLARRVSKIIFDTDNQTWSFSPLKFHLSFIKIGIHYAPDQIFLVGEVGNICLKLVKRVRVDDTNGMFTRVTITCSTAQKDIDNVFRLLLYEN